MSKILRKKLMPAEILVASSLLLAPCAVLTGYGQNSPQSPNSRSLECSSRCIHSPSGLYPSRGFYPSRGLYSARRSDRRDHARGQTRQH